MFPTQDERRDGDFPRRRDSGFSVTIIVIRIVYCVGFYWPGLTATNTLHPIGLWASGKTAAPLPYRDISRVSGSVEEWNGVRVGRKT